MPTICLVLPVYNGQSMLASTLTKIQCQCVATSNMPTRIIIADNHSTDSTREVAAQLVSAWDNVEYMYIDRKGRGNALREAWLSCDAEILSYMDLDLATDLCSWHQLVGEIASGSADLVTGSRRIPGSRIVRSTVRRHMSDIYHQAARALLKVRVRDLQCGFKALNRRTLNLVTYTLEDEWLFDTELIALCAAAHLSIQEIPVVWNESNVSTVFPSLDAAKGIVGLFRIYLRLAAFRRQFRQVQQS